MELKILYRKEGKRKKEIKLDLNRIEQLLLEWKDAYCS